MSTFISQKPNPVGDSLLILATVVKLTTNSDTVELPNMAASTNSVVQLRRPGDPSVTISQSDINTVSVTGNLGNVVMLVSIHTDPIPEPSA